MEQVGKASGRKKCGTYCVRNVLAYIRLNGFKILRVEETEQGKRYFCEDKRTGQKGQASPAWKQKNGKRAYYISWNIDSGD